MLKANTFINDIYRSFICICYPPHILAAAALFMSLLYLKISLSTANLVESVKDDLALLSVDSSEGYSLVDFPWKELFNAEYSDIKRIAESTYRFIKLVKF